MDLVPKEYKQKSGNSGGKSSAGKFLPSGFSGLSQIGNSFLRVGIILGLIALILLGLGWGGLKIYGNSVAKQIEGQKEQQSKIFPAKEKDLITQIADLESGAAVGQNILKNHIYTSEILVKIATSTLPQVQLEGYSLDVKNKLVILKGIALNYSVLAKQILAFQDAGFSKVTTSESNLDKSGGVNFGINFEFDPKIIQK